MNDFLIRLTSIDEIKQFIRLATIHPCDVQMASGNQIANAKSFMGVFNLDFGAPVRILTRGTEEQLRSFRTSVRQYIVEA